MQRQPTFETVRLVNPLAQTKSEQTPLAPRLKTLIGKRVGLINTGKPSVEHFLDKLEELILADYQEVTIGKVRKAFSSAKPSAHEIDGEIDAAISAWGD